ncbi:hypothetical protein H3T19_04605 [Bacteroides fragilis]|nr:hypothetical protein [Bacteroides fragilis]
MMMIEISESKVEKMSDYAEKMLRYGGKLMQCIEELSEGEGIGERWDEDRRYDDDRYFDEETMGERGGYGRGGNSNRSGMGERRGVRGTGRYSRYR